MGIILADCFFKAKTPILSLPPFHGARWHEWPRFGRRKSGLDLEGNILGLLPFLAGQNPLPAGRALGLRLLLAPADAIWGVAAAFNAPGNEGEFSPRSLALAEIRDAISWSQLWPMAGEACRLTKEVMAEEVASLRSMRFFRLEFLRRCALPCRLVKKAALAPCVTAMLPFFSDPGALAHLLGHCRFLPAMTSGDEAGVLKARLDWREMRYNRQRQIVLGGLVGALGWAGIATEDTALRLVAGQCLGEGKNARYGLGFWRMPELARARKIHLPG